MDGFDSGAVKSTPRGRRDALASLRRFEHGALKNDKRQTTKRVPYLERALKNHTKFVITIADRAKECRVSVLLLPYHILQG